MCPPRRRLQRRGLHKNALSPLSLLSPRPLPRPDDRGKSPPQPVLAIFLPNQPSRSPMRLVKDYQLSMRGYRNCPSALDFARSLWLSPDPSVWSHYTQLYVPTATRVSSPRPPKQGQAAR